MTQLGARIGRMQLQILQVLWRRSEATARQIIDDLSEAAPANRSTVQTLLRKMEAKHLIDHSEQDGVFIFRPAVEQADLAENVADDLLDRVFEGSLYNLVSHLLRPEKVDAEELRKLRELINEKRANS